MSVQAFNYFQRFEKDSAALKLLVRRVQTWSLMFVFSYRRSPGRGPMVLFMHWWDALGCSFYLLKVSRHFAACLYWSRSILLDGYKLRESSFTYRLDLVSHHWTKDTPDWECSSPVPPLQEPQCQYLISAWRLRLTMVLVNQMGIYITVCILLFLNHTLGSWWQICRTRLCSLSKCTPTNKTSTSESNTI